MNRLKSNYPISYSKQTIEKDDINSVSKALTKQYLTQGSLVNKFEKNLTKYFKSNYCTVLSNGTAALHLAGRALGWNEKDTVITTPITFVATANSILYSNSNPEFVDIDKNSYNIDLNKLESKIKLLKKNNKKVSAVIGVDYSGNPSNWVELRYLANKYSFKLINDNCHAMGSKYKYDRGYAAKYADIVTHSYHAVKNITTGEGGAILTNSKKIAEKVNILKTHGIEKKTNRHWLYEMEKIGFNYRLTDFQSALGISQLSKLNKFVIKKRKNAKKYDIAFSDLDNIILPKIINQSYHSYHFYPVRIKTIKDLNIKNKIMEKLKKNNIFLQVHYTPIYNFKYYQKRFAFNPNDFVEANNFFREEISLPTYPNMTNSEIKYVINNIRHLVKTL